MKKGTKETKLVISSQKQLDRENQQVRSKLAKANKILFGTQVLPKKSAVPAKKIRPRDPSPNYLKPIG